MAAEPLDDEAIFKIAFRISSEDVRADYLQQACGDDQRLRDRVGLLLRLHAQDAGFLERPIGGAAATIDYPAIAERPGTQIGPYELVEVIGEGGMGVVYMAVQKEPVRRQVALKIIKPGMDTREVVGRFRVEEQALAMMDHPNIAKVLDAGVIEATGDRRQAIEGGNDRLDKELPPPTCDLQPVTSSLSPVAYSLQPIGRPYFVMELVHGVALTQYCDDSNLATRARLELFAQVCHAVQHAHQKGIIHRDIKPSNILVTIHDGVPVPKIIDFGVAKAIGGGLASETLATGYGQLIGTPLYMSPEQAEGRGLDIDTRSDVYSLGVVLYELLTGSTPFDKTQLKDAGLDEVRRLIGEQEPPRPSTRVSTLGELATTVSEHRRTSPVELSTSLRDELDWIVMKALEKDRTRRYQTASDLAQDIEHYLDDGPVEACPPSTVYRLKKFTRRHKTGVLATAAVGLALVLGAGMAAGQAYRATKAERLAEEQLHIATEQQRLAKEQAELAQKQRRLAEEAAQRENTLRAEAETQRTRAEGTLQIAVHALDEMCADVADNQVLAAPMAEPMLRKFLEGATDFYANLATMHAADRKLRYEQAKAYARLGRCNLWLGLAPEAESEQKRAVEEFEQLTAEAPDVPEYQVELAVCCSELGEMLDARAQHAQAEPLHEQALTLLKPLQQTKGADPDYRRCTARSHQALAFHYVAVKRLDDAEEQVREAAQGWEKLIAEFPDDVQPRFRLAQTYGILAEIMEATKRVEDAATYYEKSIGLQTQVMTRPPVNPHHRFYLSFAYNEYGRLLEHAGRLQEAETQYQKSLSTSAELAEDYPHVPGEPKGSGLFVSAQASGRLLSCVPCRGNHDATTISRRRSRRTLSAPQSRRSACRGISEVREAVLRLFRSRRPPIWRRGWGSTDMFSGTCTRGGAAKRSLLRVR